MISAFPLDGSRSIRFFLEIFYVSYYCLIHLSIRLVEMILTSLDTGQLISHIVREESGYQLFDSIIPVIHDRRDLHACQPVKAALCSKIRNEFGGGRSQRDKSAQ